MYIYIDITNRKSPNTMISPSSQYATKLLSVSFLLLLRFVHSQRSVQSDSGDGRCLLVSLLPFTSRYVYCKRTLMGSCESTETHF